MFKIGLDFIISVYPILHLKRDSRRLRYAQAGNCHTDNIEALKYWHLVREDLSWVDFRPIVSGALHSRLFDTVHVQWSRLCSKSTRRIEHLHAFFFHFHHTDRNLGYQTIRKRKPEAFGDCAVLGCHRHSHPFRSPIRISVSGPRV